MLDISLGLLVFNIVLFLALIYLLNKMMYVPLMSFMAKRDKTIADDMASVSSGDEEISTLLNKANENISIAKQEASEIKTSLISKAKEQLAEAYEAKKQALEKDMESFLTDLSSQKDDMRKTLSANLADYKGSIEARLKSI